MESSSYQIDNNRSRIGTALCCSLLLHTLLWFVLTSLPPLPFAIGPQLRFDLFWVSLPPTLASAPTPTFRPAASRAAGQQQRTEAVAADEDEAGHSPAEESTTDDALRLEAVVVAGPSPARAVAPAQPVLSARQPLPPTEEAGAAPSRPAAAITALPAAESPSRFEITEIVQPKAIAGTADVQQAFQLTSAPSQGAAAVPSKAAYAANPTTGVPQPPAAIPVPPAATIPAASTPSPQHHPTAQNHTTAPVSQPAPRPASVAQQKPTHRLAETALRKTAASSQTAAASVSRGTPAPMPQQTVPRPNAQENVVPRPTTAPSVSAAPYPEARGTSLPSLHGDLKLVMVGAGNVKLTVSFREYPKARRHKAQSRGEARRQEKVVPVIAQTGEGKREAVIETAREGIYLFMVETENGEPASATFTVTFFEKGSRRRTATLGTRTVNERSVLTRILMPDAILWEDDSAFTGILRDAESTTKFNTRTGMQWKEYNQ